MLGKTRISIVKPKEQNIMGRFHPLKVVGKSDYWGNLQNNMGKVSKFGKMDRSTRECGLTESQLAKEL